MGEQAGNTRNGAEDEATREVLVYGDAEELQQEVFVGSHRLAADEPTNMGGTDRGPNPYDLLLTALGACTSMTLTMYARRKDLPLRGVATRLRHSRIHAADCNDCETEEGRIGQIDLDIELDGPLSEDQRSHLLEIAERCPVHRTLTSETVIRIHSGSPSG